MLHLLLNLILESKAKFMHAISTSHRQNITQMTCTVMNILFLSDTMMMFLIKTLCLHRNSIIQCHNIRLSLSFWTQEKEIIILFGVLTVRKGGGRGSGNVALVSTCWSAKHLKDPNDRINDWSLFLTTSLLSSTLPHCKPRTT